MVMIQKKVKTGVFNVNIPMRRSEELGLTRGEEAIWTTIDNNTLKLTLARGFKSVKTVATEPFLIREGISGHNPLSRYG